MKQTQTEKCLDIKNFAIQLANDCRLLGDMEKIWEWIAKYSYECKH